MPEKRNLPKVVRRGCKRSFGPREQEASCTGAKRGCTGAKEGLGGAKDSWETFAPWAQKESKRPFAPSPNHFGDFPFFGQFPRSTASQPRGQKVSPHHRAAGKRTFWCGRPRFSARTSMTRRVVEKLCTRKGLRLFFGPKFFTTCFPSDMSPPCPTDQLWPFSSAPRQIIPKCPVGIPRLNFRNSLDRPFSWHSKLFNRKPEFPGIFRHSPGEGFPKDPAILKTLRLVNHYGDSNSLPR